MRKNPSSLPNDLLNAKATAMKTAIIQPMLFAALGLGTALHAANADNPNIEIDGYVSTPSVAICLNEVHFVTAWLRWPVTFTNHPVPGRYTWESQPGLQIDASQGGSFSKPPGTVDVDNSIDACTIYMKGTVPGTYDLKVRWRSDDGRFNKPDDTAKVVVNPFISATARITDVSIPDIVPLPFNYGYPITSTSDVVVSKCPGVEKVSFTVYYRTSMSPEGGFGESWLDRSVDGANNVWSAYDSVQRADILNLVGGQHLAQGLVNVTVTFVNPPSSAAFPSITDVGSKPALVERVLP